MAKRARFIMAGKKRDFAWFCEQLQFGLRDMQQRTQNPSLDLSHVLRDISPAIVAQLSDQALHLALETYRTMQGHPGSRIRSLIMAEQGRRAGHRHLHIITVTWLTLIVAVLTLVATVFM